MNGERVREAGSERGLVFQNCPLLPWLTVAETSGRRSMHCTHTGRATGASDDADFGFVMATLDF